MQSIKQTLSYCRSHRYNATGMLIASYFYTSMLLSVIALIAISVLLSHEDILSSVVRADPNFRLPVGMTISFVNSGAAIVTVLVRVAVLWWTRIPAKRWWAYAIVHAVIVTALLHQLMELTAWYIRYH